ncbi:dihydroorotate dehydrogenase [Stygiomarasmius scandens]|uniref:Dihydroorotate oxidase n=1 Tax=Marasmiellus scandens TaxID=2682957 RepID=A0ABR1JV78_9AGAR
MVTLNSITITPPVLNSSCAWASDYDQLKALYESPHTGAVTIRTCTTNGFEEEPKVHAVAFAEDVTTTSINSYGYSPHPLSQYLEWIPSILDLKIEKRDQKPFIISITTSTPSDLSTMLASIQTLRSRNPSYSSLIAVELNTSCPNIPNVPPPSYTPTSSTSSLPALLRVMQGAHMKDASLTMGMKLPPYIYRQQFVEMVGLLKEYSYTSLDGVARNPFAFLTCTNTLGNTLLFQPSLDFALPTPLGGLAGDAIHALSLGNIYTFRQLLSESEDAALRDVKLIGVGGVTSKEAAERMRKAGADVVGCATLLGKLGVKAFEVISA